MRTTFRSMALFLTATVAGMAFADTSIPEVSDMHFFQPEFGSRKATITYTLSAPGVVTLDVLTNGVSIGGQHLQTVSGDVNKLVQAGARTISWKPDVDFPGQKFIDATVRVNAWATNAPPPYMAVELTPTGSDVAASERKVWYYADAQSVPGGVSNPVYKTTAVLMRRIPASGVVWTMGSNLVGHDSSVEHIVTNPDYDYYIGVYEVTHAQWYNVMGAYNTTDDTKTFSKAECRAMRPVDQCSYRMVRGTTAYPNAPDSPDGKPSFIRKLIDTTGVSFDLPSEAQWEFACRAGHPGNMWGDGSTFIDSNNVDNNLARIARYCGNGGFYDNAGITDFSVYDETQGTAIVGSYAPNSWGLYDMHGNVYECCLDWWCPDITGLNGAVYNAIEYGAYTVIRGGTAAGYGSQPKLCTSAFRNYQSAISSDIRTGFRLWTPAEAVK